MLLDEGGRTKSTFQAELDMRVSRTKIEDLGERNHADGEKEKDGKRMSRGGGG